MMSIIVMIFLSQKYFSLPTHVPATTPVLVELPPFPASEQPQRNVVQHNINMTEYVMDSDHTVSIGRIDSVNNKYVVVENP
jgi:hypothetical protein